VALLSVEGDRQDAPSQSTDVRVVTVLHCRPSSSQNPEQILAGMPTAISVVCQKGWRGSKPRESTSLGPALEVDTEVTLLSLCIGLLKFFSRSWVFVGSEE
jgi:hypothetical protein